MRNGRALVAAQANGHHLHQPALEGASKGSVGFDAVDQHYAVGLGGEAVKQYGSAVIELADFDDIHCGFDWAAHALFIDAIAG